MHRARWTLLCFVVGLIGPAANAQTVARYDVFEHTIAYPFDASTGNPWEDVRVDVTLTSPGGGTTAIGGFYFDDDTWKFRFAPGEVGAWTWSYILREGAATVTDNGAFEVVASANPGWVRQSPVNEFRWVFDDGSPFHPRGLQDCIYPEGEPWFLDEDTPVTRPEYLQVMADEAGMNLWRLNNANCSWSLFRQIDPAENIYSLQTGRLFDATATDIRAAGLRIFMTIFGTLDFFPFPNDAADPAKMAAVERYVKYVSDRYGAYVDYWELGNELAFDEYDDAWIQRIAPYLRSVDPYDHPISMSHGRGDMAEIELDAPHRYLSPNWSRLDNDWLFDINRRRIYGKPIVHGEVGNKNCNDEPDSVLRWRVVPWVMFFNEASLVFWNTPESSTFCQPFSGNVYMDAPFRANQRAVSTFSTGFDRDAVMAPVTSSAITVRAYGLSGPRNYGVYLYAYADPFGVTSEATVDINPRGPASGRWIRTSDGAVLGSVDIPAGPQTISVPSFTADIALRLDIAAGSPPTVEAGPDTAIVLPAEDTVLLDGTVTDPDGPPAVTWSLSAGPAGAVFADPAAIDTAVTFTEVGVYTLTLTADDSLNPPVVDDLTVTVDGSPPEVRNVAALDVTATGARLTGRLESAGGADAEVSVHWGRSDGGTDPAAWEASAALGSFPDVPAADVESAVMPLEAVTTYFYRFRARNDFGETWAATSDTFLTLARVRRGDALPPSALVDDTLPWGDPEQVIGPGYPPLLYYQVEGVAEIVLVRTGTSVTLDAR